MSYWDTSTLAKLYVPEKDSGILAQYALDRPAIVTAKLAVFEMRHVVFRKESEGQIQAGSADEVLAKFTADLANRIFPVLDLTSPIEAEFNGIMDYCYRRKPPLLIRTFDAIHLASARSNGETELFSTDKRMREGGALLGFSLFPS